MTIVDTLLVADQRFVPRAALWSAREFVLMDYVTKHSSSSQIDRRPDSVPAVMPRSEMASESHSRRLSPSDRVANAESRQRPP